MRSRIVEEVQRLGRGDAELHPEARVAVVVGKEKERRVLELFLLNQCADEDLVLSHPAAASGVHHADDELLPWIGSMREVFQDLPEDVDDRQALFAGRHRPSQVEGFAVAHGKGFRVPAHPPACNGHPAVEKVSHRRHDYLHPGVFYGEPLSLGVDEGDMAGLVHLHPRGSEGLFRAIFRARPHLVVVPDHVEESLDPRVHPRVRRVGVHLQGERGLRLHQIPEVRDHHGVQGAEEVGEVAAEELRMPFDDPRGLDDFLSHLPVRVAEILLLFEWEEVEGDDLHPS
jgi:hypothetical protein